MSENALITTNQHRGALAQYGQRNEVSELVSRLMALHPQANEVGEQGMMAVAQTALLLGANPLPGANEIHVWKDNKGKTCFQLGVGYYRRKSQVWGGVLFQIRPRQMRDDERREYGIAQGQIAAICIGANAADVEKYAGLGFKANEIWDMCGRIGVGTASLQEYAKSGRPQVWTALKRAEVDMLRQLFPVQMGNTERAAVDVGVMVDEPAHWDRQVFESGEPDKEPIITGEFSDKTIDDLNAELFGDDSLPQPPRFVPNTEVMARGMRDELPGVVVRDDGGATVTVRVNGKEYQFGRDKLTPIPQQPALIDTAPEPPTGYQE